MQIGKILFPITTLGPGKRLGIWTQGCTRFCKGCSNPELQTFDKSKDVSPQKIFEGTKNFGFDAITISGGEPFLQKEDLKELVQLYVEDGCDDILVYTGFKMEYLADMHDENVDYVLSHISVLIDGEFVQELVDNVPLRGSSNQRVWVLNKKFEQQYNEILQQEKKIDILVFNDEIHFIGIPFEGYEDLYKRYAMSRRNK